MIHLHMNTLHKFTNIKRLLETPNNSRTEKMMCWLPDYTLATVDLSSTIFADSAQPTIQFSCHVVLMNDTCITGFANVLQVTP